MFPRRWHHSGRAAGSRKTDEQWPSPSLCLRALEPNPSPPAEFLKDHLSQILRDAGAVIDDTYFYRTAVNQMRLQMQFPSKAASGVGQGLYNLLTFA